MKEQLFKMKRFVELKKGDIILHPILRSDGLLFLNKDKKLTDSLIVHLAKLFPKNFPVLVVTSDEDYQTYKELNIQDTTEFKMAIKEVISYYQKYSNIPLTVSNFIGMENDSSLSFLNAIKEESFFPMWDELDHLFDSTRLLKRSKSLIIELDRIISKDESLIELYKKVMNYHDVLYINSINATFLAFAIGISLELSDEEIIDLSIASLFANIGYTKIPIEQFIAFLNKDYTKFKHLDDSHIVKSHIKHSFDVISSSDYCHRKNVIMGILDHHEHYDGSGLPLNKKGKEIHLFGRIIAIAQLYDELVGGYIKETSLFSYDALIELWSQSGKIVDPDIIRIFLNRIKIYKVGELIKLSTDKAGIIKGFSNYLEDPLRPIIELENGEQVDLSKMV